MNSSTFSLQSLALLWFLLLPACAPDRHHKLLVSIADQKMMLFEDGKNIAVYPISTSRYGVGDEMCSYKTPLGHLYIAKKVGREMPLGMAFKDRKPTGEILLPNTPGRDPIVTRLLWLRGKEAQNKNAFARYIYIHGTTQERSLGKPASFGCIRMSSSDIAALYDRVGKGAEVEIVVE